MYIICFTFKGKILGEGFMKKCLFLLVALFLMLCFLSCTKEDETKGDSSVVLQGDKGGDTSNLSEEEAWKKEPMYGKEVIIGYTGGLCTSAPALTKVKGYFDKCGIDVKVINVQSKLDSLGTGKIQLMTDHIATLLVPTVNGMDIIFTTGAHTGCKSLYVLKDSGIDSTKDLIGKTVAVPDGIGDSDHNIGLRFFNHDGISPKEVKFRQVELSASILAMENGEIQAVVMPDQFAETFMQEGKLKIIRSLTFDEDFQKEPCCIHAFSKTFVNENPITAKKMTKAIKECSAWIQENIEEAAQALFDNNWASGDYDQAVRMMKTYNWTISDEYTEEALKNIVDDYKTFGLIAENKNTNDVLQTVWKPLLK